MFKIIIYFVLMLTVIMSLNFSTCNNDKNEPRGPGFINERSKYFYGAGEMIASVNNNDPMQTPEMAAKLAGALGMQTFRLWMHTGGDFAQRQHDNSIKLNETQVTVYKNILKLLADEGVTNIIGMTHYYPFPSGMVIAPGQYGDLGAFPRPGSNYYNTFMKLIEETFYQMAKTFTEVKYWECGNETNDTNNGHMYCRPADGGTPFTKAEKAHITTDLMFYAAKGMKRGNPNSVSVMPGLVFDNTNLQTGIVYFLKQIYENIASGKFPSTGLDAVSTNNDDYFDVLNWHPYEYSGKTGVDSSFIKLNNAVYTVAGNYGDAGKKVFFTEFGWTTTEDNRTITRAQFEERQKNYLAEGFVNIYNYLPYVESVIVFRMFDNEKASIIMNMAATIETGFGLFTSAGMDSTWKGPRPKKMTVELFKLIKGINADISPLYQYYDDTKPNDYTTL